MRKGTLADFFAASPLKGSGLKIERAKGRDREFDLDEDVSNASEGLNEDHGVANRSKPSDRDHG